MNVAHGARRVRAPTVSFSLSQRSKANQNRSELGRRIARTAPPHRDKTTQGAARQQYCRNIKRLTGCTEMVAVSAVAASSTSMALDMLSKAAILMYGDVRIGSRD